MPPALSAAARASCSCEAMTLCWATTSPPRGHQRVSPDGRGQDIRPPKIALIPVRFVPTKDIKAATLAKQMREFARAASSTITRSAAWASSTRCCRSRTSSPPRGHHRRGQPHLHHGAVGAFSRRGLDGLWPWGMATGESWFKVRGPSQRRTDRQNGAVGQRPGRYSAPHRRNRRGRRAVSVPRSRRRKRNPDGRPPGHREAIKARRTAFSRWTTSAANTSRGA